MIKEKQIPFVSIIIACRNEENYISKCLESIINNNFPKESLEILIVDGMSEDRTREKVEEYSTKCSFIKLLDNPKKVTPVAMNIGIRNSKGKVVILVNAHCVLNNNFLKYNIEYLSNVGADAVGGMLNTVNDSKSTISQCIPMAADSVFGSGGNRYRSRKTESFVNDTLPYCAYPRETFGKFGYIDEELIRNQDEEFNYRILRKSGKIFFTPKIKSLLFIRPSLKKLWKQHFQYGYFKPLVSRKVGTLLTWRQLMPACFVGSLIISVLCSLIIKPFIYLFFLVAALYLTTNLVFSFFIAVKKGMKYFLALPIAFGTLHFSYGLGYLIGIFDFILLKKHKKKKIEDMPLTR
ncbi:MAG: glycosyltransferase family 2 protein [Deltaproteobacteria bacterium]|nr:glycosyltransferase family 2 protein [Deltaproteobacteria bacterium]